MLWEQLLSRPKVAWLKFAYPVLMLLGGAVLAPLAIPLLPPETYIRYTKAIGLEQPAIENHQLGPLPQIFADQFGWEEMAATVARVYNSLPPEVRARTAIFAQTYGQAGAIDLFVSRRVDGMILAGTVGREAAWFAGGRPPPIPIVTVNGPGWMVATFDSGGSGATSGFSGHGIKTLGWTTRARSFSIASASIVGPASTPSTFTTAQPFASPSGTFTTHSP